MRDDDVTRRADVASVGIFSHCARPKESASRRTKPIDFLEQFLRTLRCFTATGARDVLRALKRRA